MGHGTVLVDSVKAGSEPREEQMLKTIRISAATFVVVFVLAQAIRINTVNPRVDGDIAAPPAVAKLLRGACYDCHSNETVWPWYSQVAPISWLLSSDVDEGRRELNFSAWSTYDPKRQAKKLRETAKEIDENDMPPWYYVLAHADAKLSDAERATLRAWAVDEAGKLPK